MSLPRFSVQNTVLVNMMMLVLLAAGGICALKLVREMFPESRPDRIMTRAIYLGVQPEEIEKAVTIKIEEKIRDIEGVEKVDSKISEGVSVTIATLLNEVDDVDSVLQEIKNDVDSIEDLPDDLDNITFELLTPRLPVISVAIFGDGEEADRKRAARSLQEELRKLPGVSDVEISGTRDDEISVEVRPERLLEYDITFDEVAAAIRNSNLDVSGGSLKGARSNVSVRTLGEKQRGVDLEELAVRSEPDGRKIVLSNVAEIRDGFIESDLESLFNGKTAVNCVVYKTPSQDAIDISTLVKAYVAGKQGEEFDAHGFTAASNQPWYVRPFSLASAGLSWVSMKIGGRPDPMVYYELSRQSGFDHNFEVALHTDLARFVEGRLDLLLRNGKTGLILVLLSLNLFLNWRVAFWAAIGLPVSFLGAFLVMWMLGATINLLSMFGLIIVLGIIVDDAIVIGENIYRHVEEGMSPAKAAIHGAEGVMWPVTVAVLTTIAAFSPMFFIRGQIGDLMGQLPIVVLAALSVSLIEALVILPAHLAHLPSKKKRRDRAAGIKRFRTLRYGLGRLRLFRDQFVSNVLTTWYERLLRVALSWRYVTVAVAVATLMMSFGLLAGGIVERVFVQKMDSETLICGVEMPVGSTAGAVKRPLKRLSDLAVSLPEVANVQMFVARQYDIAGAGATGMDDQSHLGQLVIELRAADERDRDQQRSSEQLLVLLREESGKLPGVNSVTWDAMHGGPGGKDIHIRVSGGGIDELLDVSEELKAELGGYEGVFDLDDDFDKGKREVRLTLRESARPTGITVGVLGHHVRSAIYGREARRVTRNRESVKIMVRYPEVFRRNIYHLESMWIPVATRELRRGWIPLGEVADFSEAESYSTIYRSQQERAVTVYGDVDENVASTFEILANIRQKFDSDIRPRHPGTQIEFLGSFEEQTKAFGGLKLAFPVALLIIYMLLAGLFRWW